MNLPPDERNEHQYYYPNTAGRGKRTTQIAILAIAVAVLVIGGWWATRSNPEPEVETIVPEPVAETVEPEPEVITPEPEVAEPEPEVAVEVEPEPETPPLPGLDDSDEFVRTALLPLNNDSSYQSWLQTDNLIRRATAITDGVSRGTLLQKFMPVKSPAGKFKARKQGQDLWIATDNYSRYNTLVDSLTAIEPEKLAGAIRQLKPLMESAFGEQGYPDRTFDDTLLAAIDQLVATPSYEQPPELVLESVHYKFKDPSIEGLSDVQKQLIRSGPENTRKLQSYLQQLQDELKKQQ